MTDLETLKAWVHWKQKEQNLSEDDAALVKAVDALIAENARLREQLAQVERENSDLCFILANGAEIVKERDAARAEAARMRALYGKAFLHAHEMMDADAFALFRELIDKEREALSPASGTPVALKGREDGVI